MCSRNNKIQNVPCYNTQVSQSNEISAQLSAYSKRMSVSTYTINYIGTMEHIKSRNQYIHTMLFTSDEEILGFNEKHITRHSMATDNVENTKKKNEYKQLLRDDK